MPSLFVAKRQSGSRIPASNISGNPCCASRSCSSSSVSLREGPAASPVIAKEWASKGFSAAGLLFVQFLTLHVPHSLGKQLSNHAVKQLCVESDTRLPKTALNDSFHSNSAFSDFPSHCLLDPLMCPKNRICKLIDCLIGMLKHWPDDTAA